MIKIDYERYGVPRIIHKSFEDLKLCNGSAALNTLKLAGDRQLDFYSNLNKAKTLVVSFHGAYNVNTPASYPMFWRIKSLSDRTGAFLAFTDPTRLFGEDEDILLSWFIGKSGWDPQSAILGVIEAAMKSTGAQRVMLVGGSGGGFAALRVSAALTGSCAFVQDATVSLKRHNPKIKKSYFRKAWPGCDPEEMMKSLPELFDMPLHYRLRNPKNFVFMTQSTLDQAHLNNHFALFAEAHNLSVNGGQTHDQSRILKAYKPKVSGHGKITSREFNDFYQECTEAWNKWEKSQNKLLLFDKSIYKKPRNLVGTLRRRLTSLSFTDRIPMSRRR